MKRGFWTGLTALLAGLCLALLALAGLLGLVLGQAPGDGAEPAADSGEWDDELMTVALNNGSLESYAGAILQQPLFFADRELPDIIDPEEAARLAAEEQENQQEEPAQELDARVAGIIITPDKRIAMVADNKAKKTVVMREGMTLEGEQAAWKLDSIGERAVSFAAGDRSTELELKVNTEQLRAPAVSNSRRQAASSRQTADLSGNNNTSEAERRAATAAEIRRRIAERRAQLRAQRAQEAEGNEHDGNR